MKQKNFVLKGDICYSKTKQELITKENHFLVCEDGRITGVFPELPKVYENLPLHDCSGQLIIPGLVDLHVHAPQYTFRGMGMDMELLDWLDTRTFPEETRYEDISYAEKAYRMFVGDLQRSATTRACIFATRHEEATVRLMELLEEAGVCAYVGKVCMDRNSPDPLRELDADTSANATKRWISACQEKGFSRVKPILTPRFIPTCTDELMEQLSEIQKQYQLPMQSHLSENIGEIAWVKELCPWSESYGEAYEHFGLFGKEVPTIMAHCVHSTKEEREKMLNNGVFIAHCPQSNTNLSSGIAPVRVYLEENHRIGLGSDIAGGASLSIFRAMTDAIQMSKMRWRLVNEEEKPVTVEEAFFMGTKGGGAFFGNVGSFEPGYEADILVLDESRIPSVQKLTVRDRLERFLYLCTDADVKEKYVAGEKLF